MKFIANSGIFHLELPKLQSFCVFWKKIATLYVHYFIKKKKNNTEEFDVELVSNAIHFRRETVDRGSGVLTHNTAKAKKLKL